MKTCRVGWRLVLLLAVIAGWLSPVVAAGDDKLSRPNIVLMMADDLGWGDTGYNGHPHLKTPHLDAMARAGMRFERFYSGAPVCSPTRGSCLTGRHPFRYGIFSANVGHMRTAELTLAELLREQGYATGHFGKWHLGTLTKTIVESNRGGPKGAAHFSPPWENGFDESFSTEAKVPTWDPLLKPKGKPRKNWWDAIENAADAAPYGTNYWANGNRVTEELRGDDSKIIMDRALPFIRAAAAADKPFFAVIWFHAPHLPVVAGPKYAAMYSQFDKHTQHYYGCITALDEQVGRLRGELRESGIDRNTLLCFCSDNGPEGNSKAPGSAKNLRGRKRSLFEGGVRVPGIIEWPARVKAGASTAVPASTSDYLPTILAAVGGEMLDGRPLDGVSLLPLLAGKIEQRPRPIPFESAGQLALVDNRYKLIYQPGGKGKRPAEGKAFDFMLFDLVEDPAESRDLAEEHPEIVNQMTATLLKWRAECKQSLAGGDYDE